MKNFNAGVVKYFVMGIILALGVFSLSACSGDSGNVINDLGVSKASTQKYPKSVDSSRSFELTQDISEIEIEGMVADIDIMFSTGNDIASSLKGEFEVSDNGLQTDLVIEKDGDVIKVTEKYSTKGITIGSSNLKLIVEIPEAFTGDLRVKSVAGDVIYQCGSSLKNNISIENVSGSVEAQIPANAGFVLKSSTTAGSVEDDFGLGKDGGAVGDKKYDITVKTVAGSIKIVKKQDGDK